MDETMPAARDRLRFGIFMPSVSSMPNLSRYKADPEDWTYPRNRDVALAAQGGDAAVTLVHVNTSRRLELRWT